MDAFKKFVRELPSVRNEYINPSLSVLEDLASKDPSYQRTQYGSASFASRLTNRSAKFTHVIYDPTPEHVHLLKEVNEHLKSKEMLQVDATIGISDPWRIGCRTFIPKEFARVPYMWSKSLFPASDAPLRSTYVNVPDWPETKILVYPKEGITLCLGSDYFGECKKAHLRMGMYLMKQAGGLGLHAGSKIIRVQDKSGKLVEKGMLLFGLSGTGKTSLTIHDHNLSGLEGVVIRQDDVVLLTDKGYAYGTENGYYIKTEGLEPSQSVLFHAATQPHAALDNVFVKDGIVDFKNVSLTKNGRGIVLRSDIDQCDDSIDLPSADLVVFITRRNDIVPPVARLTPEQGAAAFMLGESIETSAGDPTKDGMSKREVGTNPFIIGPEYEEGNRFLEIVRNNPQMHCYVLNTGKVGGNEKGDKLTVADSANILQHLARDDLTWERDPTWGFEVPTAVPGVDNKKLKPSNYYSQEEYYRLCKSLSDERVEWMRQFPELVPSIPGAMLIKK